MISPDLSVRHHYVIDVSFSVTVTRCRNNPLMPTYKSTTNLPRDFGEISRGWWLDSADWLDGQDGWFPKVMFKFNLANLFFQGLDPLACSDKFEQKC